jgi:hypothetical protein
VPLQERDALKLGAHHRQVEHGVPVAGGRGGAREIDALYVSRLEIGQALYAVEFEKEISRIRERDSE